MKTTRFGKVMVAMNLVACLACLLTGNWAMASATAGSLWLARKL